MADKGYLYVYEKLRLRRLAKEYDSLHSRSYTGIFMDWPPVRLVNIKQIKTSR